MPTFPGPRMTWTKLSDSFGDECAGLSDAAFRTHVEALLWVMRRETGGRITDRDLRRLAESPAANDAAAELVSAGFWHQDEAGYFVDHHMEHQPDLETLAARRKAATERQARLRRRKAGLVDVGQRELPDLLTSRRESRRDETRDPGRAGSGREVPSRPDPVEGREGTVTEVDARERNDPLPDEPPLCPRHEGMDRDTVPACAGCGRRRKRWEAARTEAERPPPWPAWCGECHEPTRLVEIDDGTAARCPRCHPRFAAAKSSSPLPSWEL